MLRTRRENVSAMSGGPDLPKWDIVSRLEVDALREDGETRKGVCSGTRRER